MARSETAYLLELWDKNICPFCKESFDPKKRVGTGQKKNGGFCSLTCYARYYELDLRERARRRQQDSDN
jgi:hypothetical protein